ncbi:isovaleryl-CoA dehydrogenase [Ktedonobacter racemifer]|uniref:Acyl-CoA dehydrogenase domain protein n=1 Tax=Ktedonobacter racemifer DSM 44963 TaxID=485913 RepID=D6TYJ3_KTERA|nr:isovaleryl-CoA dehydrogenase [Ktedonobacter racemifer]EFH83273.1 acyl-CoA dehydrogenase domain protein [Ktedonobacter racemifer DSM 44963]
MDVFAHPAISTHTVANQPPPLVQYNPFTLDSALVAGIQREGAGWAEERLSELGRYLGSSEVITQGFEANTYPPELHTHDRYGHRIDEVSFHPAWHQLMGAAVNWGTHALSWREDRPGAQVARAAGFYLFTQVEAGHGCPISMTHAAIPVLRHQPELAETWLPGLLSLEYDFGLRPATEKRGLLCGMGMTEKQGGSDVRANTTRAVPAGELGAGTYLLTGHKWFCSAPMCDVFLVLAQAPGGLSCFLLPRVLPDGTRNSFFIQRLKDKLGNRSNASSEAEFQQTVAFLVGEEGQGVRTIIEMVNYTRLDCILGSTAMMRQALTQALHHTRHRQAFGRPLLDQSLMRNVLADLSLEVEAAITLALRLARACDQAPTSTHEEHIKRLGTALGKYWVTKRGPTCVAEALECLGGNGYVEESIMPRLYREMPLNSIWEGSGNVNCLDVLRALAKQPQVLESFFTEVAPARAANKHLSDAVQALQQELSHLDNIEWRARFLVERMALILQGALLVQHAPAPLADAFCTSRLGGTWGHAFGTLPPGIDSQAILARSLPS